MAHFFLTDERLTGRKMLGIALALGGALLLVLQGESGLPDANQASPLGFLLVMVGMIAGSAMAIYARKYLRQFEGFDVATARMIFATLFMLPIVLLFADLDFSRVSVQGYTSLAYTALVGAFLGLIVEFYIIKRFGATAAAMTAYVIPVVATVGGALFLDERITLVMLIGMALIVLGIAIINQQRQITRRGYIPPT